MLKTAQKHAGPSRRHLLRVGTAHVTFYDFVRYDHDRPAPFCTVLNMNNDDDQQAHFLTRRCIRSRAFQWRAFPRSRITPSSIVVANDDAGRYRQPVGFVQTGDAPRQVDTLS